MSETIVREFVELFMEALNNLYDKESSVIANKVNERCMAAHLFAFMKNSWHKYLALNPYQVDFEYNREGLSGLPKRLC